MKSHPVRIVAKVPFDVVEGTIHIDTNGEKYKITKIKSVKFIDMRTFEVICLCKSVES